jgi:hypothetical protein
MELQSHGHEIGAAAANAQGHAQGVTRMHGPSMQEAAAYEIRFQSLFHEGRALAFPCDRNGRVDLDAVNERVRSNYLYARAMIGRDYAMPFVMPTQMH